MTGVAARLVWIEIRGFRAFGTQARRLAFGEQLVVVHAGNSQGKTSLAKALEFLITGRSSRRELLGGAKAEYHQSLRNAHLPNGDHDVYIEAGVYGPDGAVHQVRRELVCDFGPGTECESRLVVDGKLCDDLTSVGLAMNDPPVRAPVLLQHTLRHVLSTEPKQRVGYFKALLSLTDLDMLRERVREIRVGLDRDVGGNTLNIAAALAGTPAAAASAALDTLANGPPDRNRIASSIDAVLLNAGAALLGIRSGSLEELRSAAETTVATRREDTFPLRAFTADPPSVGTAVRPDLSAYANALTQADQETARLAPLLAAVLAVEDFAHLDHPVDCPVCATPGALTPARIDTLRNRLRHSTAVDDAVALGGNTLQTARRDLDRFIEALSGSVPAAGHWGRAQLDTAAEQVRCLGGDDALVAQAHTTAEAVATAAERAEQAARSVGEALTQAERAMAARHRLPGDLDSSYTRLAEALQHLQHANDEHVGPAEKLRTAVEPAIRERLTASGLTELVHLVTHVDDLISDLVADAGRRRTVRRLTAADRALSAAAGRVLDTRFAQMSDAIASWWASIRPEELVSFGGVKRRAGGALFVNLIAALRADPSGAAVERDALGVYSDSQLNALGLSIFLARAELVGSPVIVLDDPIPGSDADHRLTFVQNTLARLLAAGVQVVLTTYDNKLADWAQSNHDHYGPVSYELTLADPVAGTDPTQTSDTFSRLMLEAEDHLHAPTPRGKRGACVSYRVAAERLAKQIVATGRTDGGQPCTVADIHTEASMLGDLVPLVRGFALSETEKSQWSIFNKVLNPGSHDDDVPSTTDLKQIRGNLKKIAKAHRGHWPNGLLV